MSEQENDGWEYVTDPQELKALGGVAAVQQAAKAQAQHLGAQANRPWDALPTPPTGEAAKAHSKVLGARAMLRQLAHVRQLYDRDMSGTGVAGLAEYNPFRGANQDFDGAVASIPLLARQAFRVVGSGADTEGELKVILDALPNRWSFDRTNQERFKGLDRILRGFIDNYGPAAGYNADQIARMRSEHSYNHTGLPKAPPPRGRSSLPAHRPDADDLRRRYNLK